MGLLLVATICPLWLGEPDVGLLGWSVPRHIVHRLREAPSARDGRHVWNTEAVGSQRGLEARPRMLDLVRGVDSVGWIATPAHVISWCIMWR